MGLSRKIILQKCVIHANRSKKSTSNSEWPGGANLRLHIFAKSIKCLSFGPMRGAHHAKGHLFSISRLIKKAFKNLYFLLTNLYINQ